MAKGVYMAKMDWRVNLIQKRLASPASLLLWLWMAAIGIDDLGREIGEAGLGH